MYRVFTGATIGALTVREPVHWVGGTGRSYGGFMCLCSCGAEARVRTEDLAHGKHLYCTKQCTARSPRILADWLANTKRSGECMLWQGAKTNGYGRIKRDGVVVHAHREVHRLVTGDSPEAVMHTCDTPLCINPAHLRSGTNRENTADMVAKGRQSKGDTHHKSKLTERQVREIRAALTAGVPKLRLAKAYGISRWALSSIEHNLTWKDVK
jgi:hypothetical protein